ncbi:MAG: DUF3231 family protein [Bacillota bacterium]|jgi:hypothetical protein
MFTQNPRKTETRKIGCMQTYTLWRCLFDRYILLDHFNGLKNYVHDKDFLIYLTKTLDDYQDECRKLEKLLEKYAIPGPEPNLRDVNVGGNSEVTKDKGTAQSLYLSMSVDTMRLMHALKDQFINDDIREFTTELAKTALRRVDSFISFIKLKNWLSLPPLYPNTSAQTKEIIAANEVYLLFEHLAYRYQNSRLTLLFSAATRHEEFAALLKSGLKILEKEIKTLEDKLLEFGITLPKRYSIIEPLYENKDILEDRYMYNTILRGMKDALSLQGSLISEITANDDLRKFFMKLTFDEMNYINKFTKIGKLRGWISEEPVFIS